MANTVALPDLTDLNIKDYIDNNLDATLLYHRACKVFLSSFLPFRGLSDNACNMFNKKFKEFTREIAKVLDVPLITRDELTEISAEVRNENYIFTLAIVEIKGMKAEFGRMRVSYCSDLNSYFSTDLNIAYRRDIVTKEILNDGNNHYYVDSYEYQIDNHYYSAAIRDNKRILITINAKSSLKFTPFVLLYRELHPEGFTGWHFFGYGVEMLIRIRRCIDVQNNTAISYHMKLVYDIMDYKAIDAFDIQQYQWNKHQSSASQRTVTTMQGRTDHESEHFYWSSPLTDTDRGINQWNLEELKLRNRLKFSDIHIYNDIKIEMSQQKSCVCNEWCSLSAFYYHNPILRLLMVQHNQLYLNNCSSIADWYLAVTTYMSTYSDTTAPMFRVIKSINEMSVANLALSNANNDFELLLLSFTFTPKIEVVYGLSYKHLRFDCDLDYHVNNIFKSLFTDDAIEFVCDYYEVLVDLHFRIAEYDTFVPQYLKRDFEEEIEANARMFYYDLMEVNITNVMKTKNILFHSEPLFTTDYSISRNLNEQQREVIVRRNKIKEQSVNPYNVSFSCGQLLSVIINVCNSLLRVDPILPALNSLISLRRRYTCLIFFDQKLSPILDSPYIGLDCCAAKLLTKDEQIVTTRVQSHKHFTLKNYSIAHFLQQLLIESTEPRATIHPSIISGFIYITNWIEASLTVNFANEYIFIANDGQQLVDTFNSFYVDFWGKPDHERLGLDYNDIITSVCYEHTKLYYWLSDEIGGNELPIFRGIFMCVDLMLNDVLKYAEKLYRNDILDVLKRDNGRTEYITEIGDQLVFWLCKAICFHCVRIAALFIKQIHNFLQKKSIVNAKHYFAFCKPGFVHLLSTYRKDLVPFLNFVQYIYICFDDEFGRIANVFEETRKTIKIMFRKVYNMLSRQWKTELETAIDTYQPTIPGDAAMFNVVIRVHFAIGFTFIAAFVDEFRKESLRIRKSITLLTDRYRPTTHANPRHKSFVLAHRTAQMYLKRPDDIQLANPYRSQPWLRFLHHIITEFKDDWLRKKVMEGFDID